MTTPTGEHADLLETLAKHRDLLRYTVRDLDDERATRRTTPSELTLGGIIKHVATVEERWRRFIEGGAEGMNREPVDWAGQFRQGEGETLDSLLKRYDQVAAETDALIAATADLGLDHELPKAPWFEPGARWSVRRVVLHLIAETAQHAGHADIIREAIDGQKSMG